VRFLSGDMDAFRSLYVTYSDSLFAYGMSMTNDKSIVNECISSMFLKLYEKRKNLSKAESIMAYLVSTLRREIMKKLMDKNLRYGGSFVLGGVRDFVDDSDEVDFNAEMKKEDKRAEALKAAFMTLSPQQRDVIYLKFFLGLSSSDIARVLNVTQRTIYNVTFNALSRMRDHINVEDLQVEDYD